MEIKKYLLTLRFEEKIGRFLFEQITQIEIKIWTNIMRKFTKVGETSLCTNT